MKKRILSFLLALLLLFGMLPVNVVAEGNVDYNANKEKKARFLYDLNVSAAPEQEVDWSAATVIPLADVSDLVVIIDDCKILVEQDEIWYKVRALEGQTLPEALQDMWIFHDTYSTSLGATIEFACDVCDQFGCTSTHDNWCELCRKDDCGVDHNQTTDPTDPTDPDPTDPSIPDDSCECCENCTGAEGCTCQCGECDFCQPEEPELPVLTHPTGVEVTAESFPEGVTLTVQDANVASQLNKYRIPESRKVFGLDISLLNADSSIYQPGGALVKVPVSAPVGTKIGIIHDHNGNISFMGVTEVLADGTVEFYTDSFSTFAGFTVDFHYNGVDYSIEGLSSILLSDLFTAMGIEEDAYAAKSVVFSDNTLVGVTQQDDGNWLLTSLEAFSTNETLIITFNDDRTIVIDVTDVNGNVTKDGVTYATLTYTNNVFTLNLDVAVTLYDVDAPNGTSTVSASNTFGSVDRRSVPTLSFPERGKWYRVKSYSNLDSISYEDNYYEILLDLNTKDASIIVECIPRSVFSQNGFVTVSQKRYVAIGDSYENRTVKVLVNGSEKVNVVKIFANRSNLAAEQLDVQYIPSSSYFYGNYSDLTECAKDDNGNYVDTNGLYYSYSGGNGGTYTIPLYTRYNVTFNGNGATSGSMTNQAFVWGKQQNLKQNAFSRSFTVTYDAAGGTCSTARDAATATFAGWATSASGSAEYSNGQSVGNEKGLTDTAGGSYPLYAKWNDGFVTLPTPNARTGYTFLGWSDGSTTYAAGASYTPSKDTTLTAQWEANGNTLTFDFNDGTGNKRDCPVIYGSSNYYEVAWLNPARSGYAFDGWYTVDGTQVYGRDGYCLTGAYWNSSNQWIGTSDLTVYAHWIPIYKVTLDNQSATTAGTAAYWYVHNRVYDGVYYYTDAACTAALANYTITKPARTGYIFGGYYTGKNGTGTQYVDANGMCVGNRYQVAGDVTLYAKWTPITYTVTYNGNPSHDGTTADSTHTYDDEKTLTPNGYERSGYKFVGWNDKADGSGKAYADQESVKNLTNVNGATVTLYAQWKPIYKITLDSQEQTEETDNFYFVYTLDAYYSDHTCNTALAGNKIVPPVKHGYTFAGFYTQEGGQGTQYIDKNGNISSACCQLNQDTTLYAAWDIITYTITYQYKDGQTADSKQSYDYETSIILKVPERKGYKFLGWTNTTYDAQKENNNWLWVNYDCVNGQMQNPGNNHFGNVILEARWEPITYTIRFNGGEGGVLPTGAKMDDITATYDAEEIQLTPNAYRRIVKVTYDVNGGKNLKPSDTVVSLEATFKNWVYNSTEYKDQASVKNLASTQDAVVQMTAQWDLASTKTPTVERDGYTFGGWKPKDAATDLYEADKTITPARDITLVAQWNPVSYTITYESGGGSAVEPTSYNIEQAVTLASAPTREGYKFNGWKLKTSGGNWEDIPYTADQVIGTGKYGNITLEAQWDDQYCYKLEYDPNTIGKVDGMPEKVYTGWIDDNKYTADLSAKPTRADYDFLGWATSDTATAADVLTSFELEGIANGTASATLYAVWQRHTGDLKLTFNGGQTNPAIVTVTGEGKTITLVLTKSETVIKDLPTGTYEVTVESGNASYTASVKDNSSPVIEKDQTEVVEIEVHSKGLNWFTAFCWVKNKFGMQN